jgi:hypothetical protein
MRMTAKMLRQKEAPRKPRVAKKPVIRMWSFRNAPPPFRALFPEGKSPDWVVHVPRSLLPESEAYLLRWQQSSPVRSVELPDGGVVHWGASRETIGSIADKGESSAISPRAGIASEESLPASDPAAR